MSNSRTRWRSIACIIPIRAKIIGPLFSAASVTIRAAAAATLIYNAMHASGVPF